MDHILYFPIFRIFSIEFAYRFLKCQRHGAILQVHRQYNDHRSPDGQEQQRVLHSKASGYLVRTLDKFSAILSITPIFGRNQQTCVFKFSIPEF